MSETRSLKLDCLSPYTCKSNVVRELIEKSKLQQLPTCLYTVPPPNLHCQLSCFTCLWISTSTKLIIDASNLNLCGPFTTVI